MSQTVDRVSGAKYYKDQQTFALAPSVPANSFGNAEIKTDAADPISAEKTEYRIRELFRQDNVAATAEEQILHVAYGDGTMLDTIRVAVIVAATGDSTVTVDVKKNGASVLAAVVTVDNSVAAYGHAVGNVNAGPAAYVDGDVFTVHVTVSAGTGTLPTGLAVLGIFDEKPL